jgi:anthranilate phosphoribosyltransferase
LGPFCIIKGKTVKEQEMEPKEFLEKLLRKEELSREESASLFRKIMEGKLTPAQTAAVLIALRCKGESVNEIAGAASVMREKSLKVPLPEELKEKVIDTCGTGGDLKGTFNVSTTTALVVAACGVPVAKHGNRSVSSKCGSADLLESFGVVIDLPPEKVAKCIEELNFGFMFAPRFHPAMAQVAGVRRELKVRTIFNLLGPLTNPAGAKRQLLGVFAEELTEKIASVLKELGSERAFVVHGTDGTDEITVCAPTKVTELKDGEIKSYLIRPEDFGVETAPFSAIKGGESLEENRRIVQRILTGEEEGPKSDAVALNAAFALTAAQKVESPREGFELAKETLKSGKAYELLCKLVKLTTELAKE